MPWRPLGRRIEWRPQGGRIASCRRSQARTSRPRLASWIVCFQEQELGDHEGRHHILDRTGDEDDALLQQTREDVVGALAPVGLLNDQGDTGIHVDIKGVAHGSTCLRPAAWDRRRESAVLLQNRNAFGHALITDIAGNASDKPVLSENSTDASRLFRRYLKQPSDEERWMGLSLSETYALKYA